jgi:chromosome segregation ATPase
MNQKNNEIPIEEGITPEEPETSMTPEAPEISEVLETSEEEGQQEEVQPVESSRVVEQPEIKKTAPEPPEKQEPSRTQKFFRKALIWLAIVVIAFGAGFLLDHLLRYKPLLEDLRETQAEQASLQEDLDEIQNQIEQLTPRLEAANSKIATLEDELEMANARTEFYQVLGDVNDAQLKIYLEDVEAAETTLAETMERLEELGPVIEEVDPDLAISLPGRLELIIAGLARDPETAIIDLELFTKDLLALEPQLFED